MSHVSSLHHFTQGKILVGYIDYILYEVHNIATGVCSSVESPQIIILSCY